MNSGRIPASRAIAGLAAGAALTIAIYCWLAGPEWIVALTLGAACAIVVLPTVGIPSLLLLRAKGMLSVYAAAALGVFLCFVPILVLLIHDWTAGTGPKTFNAADALFVFQYFVAPGALGGIFGWFVAASWRTHAA
jgi:hypothetical protein